MCYETNVLFTWCHHTEHFLRRCPKAPCSGWKGHFKSQPGLCLRCSAGPGVVALATAAWRTGAGMPMCVSATEGTSEAALRSQPPLRITEHDACPGIRKREDIGERRARFEKEERATGPYSSLNMRRANGGPRGGDARRAGGARRHYEQQTKLKPILLTARRDKTGREADDVDDGLFDKGWGRETKRVDFQVVPDVRYYVPPG